MDGGVSPMVEICNHSRQLFIEATFGNRQAVALVFFFRGSDFAKFFYKKTLAKSLPLKKYSKTYLLPIVKIKNLSL